MGEMMTHMASQNTNPYNGAAAYGCHTDGDEYHKLYEFPRLFAGARPLNLGSNAFVECETAISLLAAMKQQSSTDGTEKLKRGAWFLARCLEARIGQYKAKVEASLAGSPWLQEQLAFELRDAGDANIIQKDNGFSDITELDAKVWPNASVFSLCADSELDFSQKKKCYADLSEFSKAHPSSNKSVSRAQAQKLDMLSAHLTCRCEHKNSRQNNRWSCTGFELGGSCDSQQVCAQDSFIADMKNGEYSHTLMEHACVPAATCDQSDVCDSIVWFNIPSRKYFVCDSTVCSRDECCTTSMSFEIVDLESQECLTLAERHDCPGHYCYNVKREPCNGGFLQAWHWDSGRIRLANGYDTRDSSWVLDVYGADKDIGTPVIAFPNKENADWNQGWIANLEDGHVVIRSVDYSCLDVSEEYAKAHYCDGTQMWSFRETITQWDGDTMQLGMFVGHKVNTMPMLAMAGAVAGAMAITVVAVVAIWHPLRVQQTELQTSLLETEE